MEEEALVDVDNEIEIPIEKSKHISDFDKMFSSFTHGIKSLHMNDKTNDAIYQLCTNLIKHFQEFNICLIQDDSAADPKQVLAISSEFLCEKLRKCSTALRRKKECAKNPLFVPPRELSLGLKWEMLRDLKSKISTPILTQCKFQYIPFSDTIAALFKREDFRKVYFEYNSRNHVCADDSYVDVCCGDVMKENQLFQSDLLAIRLHISADEFEICNPIGSKATIHKLTAFYFTIQNLPPQFRSKSDNIFLFCLCYSDDLKTKYTDINDIWDLVVKDIGFLETHGIYLENGETIKGSIALMSFDNLGANSMLGFVSCFRAQFFCRFCEMPINDCRVECRENPTIRRTIESYNKILDRIENSAKVDFKDSRGIKMKCVLNELQYFHILKNFTVDPMHDLNEGVIPFALNQLFCQFVRMKIISEGELLQKVQYFDYGFLNQRNIPSMISFDKSNLGQNATQSACLLRHVPFIFWKYRECEKLKDMWLCIKSLLRIFIICFSPEITKAQIELLQEEICIHLTCLKNIGLSFIAKHHILTHYPMIIKLMGPVVFMCMFKFERKHKLLKSFMNDNCNFTNVTCTIARKHQEHLSEVTDSFTENIVAGMSNNLPRSFFYTHTNFFAENSIDIECVKQEIHSLKYCNYHYKQKLFIADNGKFHEIIHILMINGHYYLMCKQFDVLLFDEFLNSFKIETAPETIYSLIKFSELKHKNVYEKKMLDDFAYIMSDSLLLMNIFSTTYNV